MSNDLSGISSLYTSDYWKNSAQTADLENKLSTDTESMSDDELMDVCKEFEVYFVEQMFKAMQKMVPESESSNSKEMDMFGDKLTQEYAKSAAQGEGLGLAQTLYKQMKRNYGLT